MRQTRLRRRRLGDVFALLVLLPLVVGFVGWLVFGA